jgi:hypothetical protein
MKCQTIGDSCALFAAQLIIEFSSLLYRHDVPTETRIAALWGNTLSPIVANLCVGGRPKLEGGLPRGRRLVTLKDAADYIMKLPKAEQNLKEWQTAGEILIKTAEGRDFLMHARIGMLQAIHRNEVRVFRRDLKRVHE